MADETIKKRTAPKKHVSPWFWAFWTLVIVLVIGTVLLFKSASQPVNETDTVSKIAKSEATFDVSLNKRQINALVAYYLSESNDNGYSFRVEDNIMMYGTTKFLGEKFTFGMSLTPEVTKNGNIILTAKKLAIGDLPLPITTVMQYVKSSYDAPKFVSINPQKKQIYINMSELPVTQGMRFRAQQIDMAADKFVFQGGLANDKK